MTQEENLNNFLKRIPISIVCSSADRMAMVTMPKSLSANNYQSTMSKTSSMSDPDIIGCYSYGTAHPLIRADWVQWNPSVMDTLGPQIFVCNTDVFLFER